MMLDVTQESASLTLADGVRLDADIYRPQGAGEFPVLLMRQPYGRKIASTVVYAHPRWYAAHGYIVVIQDVRGRGTSTGEFTLFKSERADGLATLNWVASLDGSNGSVGMYGFSYQGMTQLYAAEQAPVALKALCPAMVGYDPYHDWAYEGGALCLAANLSWAIQMAAETARLQGDTDAFLELSQASQNLPLQGSIASQPAVLQRLAPDCFYWDWLRHANPAAKYWQTLKPKLDPVDLPMLHIGGWFDTYLRGTLRLYKEMATSKRSPQHLWVGPWAHLPWGRQVGAVDFGPAAVSPIDQVQIRWFDYWLKGIDTGIFAELPVHLFEMGKNRWRSFDHWPTKPQQTYYLLSSGLASIRQDSGKLATTPTEADNSEDVLVHDPWRPVPALGGHASLIAGAQNRRHLDDRSDVLTYTTEPLESELAIAGDLSLQLTCSADTPSFDLCVTLSFVTLKGVFHISQGFLRIANAQTQPPPYTLALQPTCVCLQTGQALRVSLSAACYPAYAVNPGTGENPDQTPRLNAQIITLRILHGRQSPMTLTFSPTATEP